MSKLLKFVDLPQSHSPKRSQSIRIHDFNEIYQSFTDEQAKSQAARCSQCGVPTCQVGCPLHNNIPDWLKLAAEGRLQEAYQMSAMTNTFPEICGRICPQDRLCEGECVIEKTGHSAVTIGDVEKFLTDTAWENGWVESVAPPCEISHTVAIIGSGPAGLSAAQKLRSEGYQVHVYDRNDRAGGLLIYGIPDFKLEKHIVLRRIKQLENAGVEFHLQCEIGKDISFQKLYHSHDAVIIATGVYQSRPLHIQGDDAPGNINALDFLTVSNRKVLGDDIAPENDFDIKDKDVIVIGGGDTAMDCVRTSIRQHAKSVSCVYRRDQKSMPGSPAEVKNAIEEGVAFKWLTAPHAIELQDGKVSGFVGQRMQLIKNQNGRSTIEPIAGDTVHYEAQIIIHALGFEPEDLPAFFEEPNLHVGPYKTITASKKDRMTSLPGVFAAGDIWRGASLVVWAIDDGRRVADSVHQWLSNNLHNKIEQDNS